MNERNENDKVDEILLPGFRFHPTDEELVGFYLKRKIQQRSLSIELIKQLDIYKYDPWDLPKMAITGEKEWYFYCPRDRKYRNSARPNRVTGGGFWKATGTDRPIYSSQGSKCIGLKKSLVFYKGKAAKGIKTDWMMHEFRLPSLTDVSVPPKRFIDKSTIPAANDAWAICRIFKKTNSTAQRALSQSWVSPLPETATVTATSAAAATDANVKSSYNITTQLSSSLQYFNNNYNNDIQQQHLDFLPYKPINPAVTISKHVPHHQLPISTGDITNSFMLSPFELPTIPPLLLNTSSSTSILGDFNSKVPEECIDFGRSQQDECMSSFSNGDRMMNHVLDDQCQWESTTVRSIGFPFSLMWDSFSSCPSEMSTSVSTSKCYT